MLNPGKTLRGAKCLALAACAMAWTGCSRALMTPPSRIGEFETPKALEKGRTAVAVSGGGDGGIFYLGTVGGSLQARKGLGGGREVGFDASVLNVGYGVEGDADIQDDASPYVFTVNSRFKYNPEGWERFCALFGGLGFGYSEPATFTTFEGGFSLGWENTRLIPYIGSKATLDVPLKTRMMDMRPRGEDTAPPDLQRAPVTWGAMNFVGLKLPIPFSGRPANDRVSLIVESHYAQFWTDEDAFGFIGHRAALQFPVSL